MLVVYRADADTFYLGKEIDGKIKWDVNSPYSSGWLKRWGYKTEDIPIGVIYYL